jgi:hypothetical protein
MGLGFLQTIILLEIAGIIVMVAYIIHRVRSGS